MWLRPFKRREFVEFLTSRRGPTIDAVELPNDAPLPAIQDDAIAIWPAAPSQYSALPSAIVVGTGAQRDFLAWTATYIRAFRPFTAFCRLIERPVAQQFLAAPVVPSLKGDDGIFCGLILGELLAQSRHVIRDQPTAAYRATLSYSIARVLALTGSIELFESTIALWSHARAYTDQQPIAVPAPTIAGIWAIALGTRASRSGGELLFESDDELRDSWRELNAKGELSDLNWKRLTTGLPNLPPVRDIVGLPRERKLEFVDETLRVLGTFARPGLEKWSFLAAYVTSILSPGTLDHAEILLPMSVAMPSAPLWYGLFAAAGSRGEIPSLPGARRISRDILMPDRVLDRPRCDIAIEELLTVGIGDGNGDFQTHRSDQIEIDILPGVTVNVRHPNRPAFDSRAQVREADLMRLLSEIDGLTMRSRDVADRLRRIIEAGEAKKTSPSRRRRT